MITAHNALWAGQSRSSNSAENLSMGGLGIPTSTSPAGLTGTTGEPTQLDIAGA